MIRFLLILSLAVLPSIGLALDLVLPFAKLTRTSGQKVQISCLKIVFVYMKGTATLVTTESNGELLVKEYPDDVVRQCE